MYHRTPSTFSSRHLMALNRPTRRWSFRPTATADVHRIVQSDSWTREGISSIKALLHHLHPPVKYPGEVVKHVCS